MSAICTLPDSLCTFLLTILATGIHKIEILGSKVGA